jgi:hypothetical protein
MGNMLSNNYYRLLDFPFNFFDKEKIEKDMQGSFDPTKNKQWSSLTRYYNSESREFFKKFNYDLINAELFYTPPLGRLKWHIDMYPPEDFIKINFVWGSTDHVMEWGELKTSTSNMTVSKTEVDTQYVLLNDTDVTSVISVKIRDCALVNIGRPHRIRNLSSRPRWCLCAILTHQSTRIPFTSAAEALNEYVVD